jgi:hypothetical protein
LPKGSHFPSKFPDVLIDDQVATVTLPQWAEDEYLVIPTTFEIQAAEETLLVILQFYSSAVMLLGSFPNPHDQHTQHGNWYIHPGEKHQHNVEPVCFDLFMGR